ncbi:MAG: ABC transporter ATP-binding protein [Nitrospirae bacterium]|nr:ABC transporter ATP-binding protein [Nitrospirota bacterium]
MANCILRVSQLGKKYHIGSIKRDYESFSELIISKLAVPLQYMRSLRMGKVERTDDIIWALRDVSFEVEPGDVLGIIGRNGAGKSTLLKLISRITKPTVGQIDIFGRVGSLLEVGTGFHPELTGRENIYLNGTILGMKRAEIDRKFEEIVEFSEVERFLDTPVKRYSSGMYVRLAFAVAAHLQSDILVVDEVLAVGDASFQKKCLGKMGDVASGGRTVLFVSHNMTAISGLCSRAILLDNGQVTTQGPTETVVSSYLKQVQSLQEYSLADRMDRKGTGRLHIADIVLEDDRGYPTKHAKMGDDIAFRITYVGDSDRPLTNVQFSMHFFTPMNQPLFNLWNEMVGDHFSLLPPTGQIRCRIPRCPLMPGQYVFNIYCEVGMQVADWVTNAGTLDIVEGDFFGTGRMVEPDHRDLFVLHHRWEIVG